MLARVALKNAAQRVCARSAVPALQSTQIARQSTISGEEYLAKSKEPYTVRQEAKGRFVSPHVDIYAFPVAAISSITMRATGGALTAGLYGASIYGLFGGDVIAALDAIKAGAPGIVLAGAKFSVAFPLAYHWIAGLRHMYIDRNPGSLNNETIENSSKVREKVMIWIVPVHQD